MPDAKNRRRIALLALVVLAVHVWLLAGMPRFTVPQKSGSAFVARTLTAPVPPPAPEAAPRPVKQATPVPAKVAIAKPQASPHAPSQAAPAVQRTAVESRPVASAATAPASAASEIEQAAAAAAPSTRAAGAAPALRISVPRSARFNYDVVAYTKGFKLNGNAKLDWRNDGREYEARLTLSAPFLPSRTQHSTGLVTSQGLAPVRFSDKVRSEEATHFDRDSGKVTFSTNKPEAALEPGVQDRLSIVLQLGAMMAGDPSRYPAGSHITMQTASTKEAEHWTFNVEGPETLSLPGGRVPAVRLVRAPRKEFDVKVELWLAPGAAYAPVRIRLTQPNGDWVDQLWSSTDRG